MLYVSAGFEAHPRAARVGDPFYIDSLILSVG